MSGTRRWVLLIVVVLVLIGGIAFARGEEHQRGQQVGALEKLESAEPVARL